MKKALSGLLGLLVASVAIADSFYCGEQLIVEGMAAADVLEACGEPNRRDGNDWVYGRGSSEFPVELHIEADGTVGQIREQTGNQAAR
jgi:hypothetical protein